MSVDADQAIAIDVPVVAVVRKPVGVLGAFLSFLRGGAFEAGAAVTAGAAAGEAVGAGAAADGGDALEQLLVDNVTVAGAERLPTWSNAVTANVYRVPHVKEPTANEVVFDVPMVVYVTGVVGLGRPMS